MAAWSSVCRSVANVDLSGGPMPQRRSSARGAMCPSLCMAYCTERVMPTNGSVSVPSRSNKSAGCGRGSAKSGKLHDHRIDGETVAGPGVDLDDGEVAVGAQHVLHLHRL